MREKEPERKGIKQIPTAIRKTRLVGDTQMTRKNRKVLEMIQAYKGMFG